VVILQHQSTASQVETASIKSTIEISIFKRILPHRILASTPRRIRRPCERRIAIPTRIVSPGVVIGKRETDIPLILVVESPTTQWLTIMSAAAIVRHVALVFRADILKAIRFE